MVSYCCKCEGHHTPAQLVCCTTLQANERVEPPPCKRVEPAISSQQGCDYKALHQQKEHKQGPCFCSQEAPDGHRASGGHRPSGDSKPSKGSSTCRFEATYSKHKHWETNQPKRKSSKRHAQKRAVASGAMRSAGQPRLPKKVKLANPT
jgi:hypothetical protein